MLRNVDGTGDDDGRKTGQTDGQKTDNDDGTEDETDGQKTTTTTT